MKRKLCPPAFISVAFYFISLALYTHQTVKLGCIKLRLALRLNGTPRRKTWSILQLQQKSAPIKSFCWRLLHNLLLVRSMNDCRPDGLKRSPSVC